MGFKVSDLLRKITSENNKPRLDSFKKHSNPQVNEYNNLSVFFSIELSGINTDVQLLEEGFILQPGTSYKATVHASYSGTNKETNLIIHSELSLFLYFKEMHDIPIIGEWKVNPADGIDPVEFIFKLPENIPQVLTTLELAYFESNLPAIKPRNITNIPVVIKGNYNQDSQNYIVRFSFMPDDLPPDELIVFEITSDSTSDAKKESYYLQMSNRLCRMYSVRADELPNVNLAKFIENRDKPATLLGKIRPYSTQDVYGILRWIKPLYSKYNQHLTLTIINYTNNEFPWELLEIEENKYIGASIKVCRGFPGIKLRMNKISSENLQGDITAYIDDREIKSYQKEEMAFSFFSPRFLNSIDEVKEILKNSLSEYELIYLATHGAFAGNDYKEIFLGSLLNNTERIVYLEDLYSIDVCQGKRPIFFVNACHSGRFIREKTNLVVGLPFVFLERFARGYIGTIGPIGSDVAAEINRCFLRTIHEFGEEITVVEVLRRIRQNAAIRFTAEKESLENQKEFLYTFMYVYYGSPWDVIRIKSNPGLEV